MKIYEILVSLTLFVIPLTFLPSTLIEYRDFNEAIIIEGSIFDIPEICTGTKVKYHITVDYNNNNKYLKQIGPNFCDEHFKGEKLKLKYNRKHDNLFFIGEDGVIDLWSIFIMSFSGILLFIYTYIIRKKDS